MKDRTFDILKKNSLSITESRRVILRLFLDSQKGAVRHSDIEKNTPNLDRVTIYRTLQSFSEKGIIHTIPSADGALRYALCHSGCEEGHHHDDHVHFVCSQCSHTQCLDAVQVPALQLPAGYVAHQIEMVVTGTCNQCQKTKGLNN